MGDNNTESKRYIILFNFWNKIVEKELQSTNCDLTYKTYLSGEKDSAQRIFCHNLTSF